MRYTLTNTGDVLLPASLGAHPAFAWPLAESEPKQSHRLIFPQAEPEPVWRLTDGLLRREPEPTPIAGHRLGLDERLFVADAVILLNPASRSVRYAAPSGPALTISWDGFRQLGIWSKPTGAEFLCIEPWYGFASPATFDGPFEAKPGLMLVEPGGQREMGWRVDVDPGQDT